jgi:hypothetical protein
MNTLELNVEILAVACGILGVLFLILLIWNIVLTVKMGSVKKQFQRLARGTTEENLEDILNRLFGNLEEIDHSHRELRQEVKRILDSLMSVKGRMGLVRFSAFDKQGSDLSFSLALIDDQKNGVVLTSLFGRDDSRIYAKPIENGSSLYSLTDEEKKAIEIAFEKS